MAKIQFGAIVVDARGKLGGHVFKKTFSGFAITKKANRSKGLGSRNNLRSQLINKALRSYASVDNVDRLLLKNFAVNNPLPDKFGNFRALSPRAMAQRLVSTLSLQGFAIPDYKALSNVVPTCQIDRARFSFVRNEIEIRTASVTSPCIVQCYIVGSAVNAYAPALQNKRFLIEYNITANGTFDIPLADDVARIVFTNSGAIWLAFKFRNASGWSSDYSVLPMTLT